MSRTLQTQATKLRILTWDFGPDGISSAEDQQPAAGDRPTADSLPEETVQAALCSERDWLQLADAVDSEEERRFCLSQVLAINRRNALARRLLEALGPETAQSSLLQPAIAALETGGREKARCLLEQIVRADRHSEQGWLWLAQAVESETERRFCLMQALAINESNAAARQQLLQLGPGPTHAPFSGLTDLPRAQVYRRRITADRLQGIREALHRHTAVISVGYLAALTLAEVLTTLIEPRVGLVLHSVLLLLLIAQAALTWGYSGHRLLFALAFAPLIRILSLFLPLAGLPQIYWYFIVSVPLFAAAIVGLRTMNLSGKDVGLSLKGLPLQLLVAVTGLTLGYVEYRILRPAPLAPRFVLEDVWLPALILFVCTGFSEELIFRGMMQRAATEELGKIGGVLYVATLFAMLHVGYQSVSDVVFVFIVALFFGVVAAHTRSIVGVSLAHGLTNVLLFLMLPFGVNPFDIAFQLPTMLGR
jgi:membrane protease YdiL (CAAX protease family)